MWARSLFPTCLSANHCKAFRSNQKRTARSFFVGGSINKKALLKMLFLENKMKICKKCNAEKSLTEFYKDSSKKDKLTIYCKTCCKVAESVYHKKNPVKKINRVRRSMIYKTGLKITMDDYNQMLVDQDHKCGICQTIMDVPRIDHNHSTGYIRMLLCGHCNTLIGMAKENITTLQNAIEYLKKFSP